MTRRAIVDWAVLVVVSGASWLAYANQEDIRDWWVLRGYQAPASVAALAEAADMSGLGERRFYASQPELNDAASFNTNCPFPDRSLVLGCYSAGRIYIFAVNNDRLDGVEEVTAAHEMLHAAYDRLSRGEREAVDALTAQAYDEADNQRLKDTIEGYRQEDPESLPNELHSILGTEIRDLPAELEDYYRRYFNDRSRVVAIAESYEQVFVELQEQIAGLEAEIAGLRERITTAEASLASQRQALDAEAGRLEDLREAGQFEQYNAGVPGYNTQVNSYNAAVEDYQAMVSRHNRLVREHNLLALEQNELVHSLDSKFNPVE
jgi:hypothetical protein